MEMADEFTFEISLTVLNHLGRNLYRSFATVLGEAISNSWDADAENVWIYVEKSKNRFFIKDDGIGMTATDFQSKFLKIGYTKRNEGHKKSPKGRPYIGRKGIGKLALLSCADKISVISKTEKDGYVGGTIDNSGLDKAIKKDLTPQDYKLGKFDIEIFDNYIRNHKKGTIICFENMKDEIKNSIEHIRKIIALYFRFSLIDKSFNIFLNGETEENKITLDDLKDLIDDTEFVWNVNELKDPYIDEKLKFNKENLKTKINLLEPPKSIKMDGRGIKGFIASVYKPRDLSIMATDERVGVDLFVNGRLRERDILKTIPSSRVAENYLYGQIHFDGLDDNQDRFSTSREGIVADDLKYKEFLENLKKLIGIVLGDWDRFRLKHHNDGDPDNGRIPIKERKAGELFNVVSSEYDLAEDLKHPEIKEKIDKWINELGNDAAYNFSSYAECFISENLIRKHIEEKNIPLSKEANDQVVTWKSSETAHKKSGNISIPIRKNSTDISYLSMDDLANLVDKPQDHATTACLARDAKEYKPMRDALMHTALLTDEAKKKLTTVYENIKGRIRSLLSNP